MLHMGALAWNSELILRDGADLRLFDLRFSPSGMAQT